MPFAASAYTITASIEGSPYPAHQIFIPSLDELYVPVVLRKPGGPGPFPLITMGRGDGRGGMPHVLAQVERLVPMQDEMIRRGYAVAYVNYRNEIPYFYGKRGPLRNLEDDMSGGENRTLKSNASLDSDDLIAIWQYFSKQPYVRSDAMGAIGISHGGEMILKALAEGAPLAAAVIAEGASHEFLAVETGPNAPRIDGELQYQNTDVVNANADKQAAMSRIRNISVPALHIGREGDHLQGIFRLAYEWMLEAGLAAEWKSFTHPDHGFCLIYSDQSREFLADPVQLEAFETCMSYFDRFLKHL